MANVRYQALGPLLSGEGSRAFLGLEFTDETQATPIVLVWVPEDATLDEERIAHITRETQRAAQLEHPHIIRVMGLAALDEGIARVVEFADGEGLRQILDDVKKLPVRIAARITLDVISGAHYAHLAGNDDGTPLVHGDLRPETLLVTHRGVTKVSGYGALSVAPREVGGSRVRGRRQHCAPEQILGGRETMSRATDVYLAGLVFYECVVGSYPFQGQAEFDQAVLNQPLPEPEEVPADIMAVLKKAMAKRAADRYPTLQAFKDALSAAIPGAASHEEVAQFLQEAFPAMAKNRAHRIKAIREGLQEVAPHATLNLAAETAPAPVPKPAAPTPPPVFVEAALPSVVVSPEALSPSVPPPPPVSAPQPVLPPPPAKQTSRASVETREEDSFSGPPKRSHARLFAFGLGIVLVVLIVAQLASSGRRRAKTATVPTPSTAPVAQEALALPDASLAQIPPPPPPVLAPEAPPPPPPPPPKVVEPPSLVITSTPELEVFADGQSLGRTPLTVASASGKRTLKLTDKGLGISVTRAVQVRDSGKTTLNVNVGKGVLSVSAPDGAVIYVNGVKKGVAPVEEIELYEGDHRLMVTVGKAKWSQSFKLRPTEKMYFNVEEQ